MTFGVLKTTIESNLVESYKDQVKFKRTLREFKENILNNKNISKLFSVYEQLSHPQGLSENDANIFLNEGLSLIDKILPSVKLPYSSRKETKNNYADIDNLVYISKSNLKERMDSRKNIVKILTSKNTKINESINIPVSSMVKIANQTLENYVETMDEKSKKIFIDVVTSDKTKLEEKFKTLKENTIEKLNKLLNEQSEEELKTKISETISKLEKEDYSQMNLVKLVSLESEL